MRFAATAESARMIERKKLKKYAHAIRIFTNHVAHKHSMLERIDKFVKDYEEFR